MQIATDKAMQLLYAKCLSMPKIALPHALIM